MFGLFQLLFSKRYWRTLFHSETWRRSGVSIRRIHKDNRARKQLLQVFGLLLTPVLCLFYLLWFIASGAGFVGACLALLMFAVVGIYRRYRPAENDGSLRLQLQSTPSPIPEMLPTPAPELRRELAELALLHAIFVDRAGSETFIRTNVLPEGMDLITRRRHLDILRKYGLYERIGGRERDLLLLPDGHWAEEITSAVACCWKPCDFSGGYSALIAFFL